MMLHGKIIYNFFMYNFVFLRRAWRKSCIYRVVISILEAFLEFLESDSYDFLKFSTF